LKQVFTTGLYPVAGSDGTIASGIYAVDDRELHRVFVYVHNWRLCDRGVNHMAFSCSGFRLFEVSIAVCFQCPVREESAPN
jgi:hypothetical protein